MPDLPAEQAVRSPAAPSWKAWLALGTLAAAAGAWTLSKQREAALRRETADRLRVRPGS